MFSEEWKCVGHLNCLGINRLIEYWNTVISSEPTKGSGSCKYYVKILKC